MLAILGSSYNLAKRLIICADDEMTSLVRLGLSLLLYRKDRSKSGSFCLLIMNRAPTVMVGARSLSSLGKRLLLDPL